MKLKSLGYSEEDILSVNYNGKPIQSVKIIYELRHDLQCAAKLLGTSAKPRPTSANSNSTLSRVGELQAGMRPTSQSMPGTGGGGGGEQGTMGLATPQHQQPKIGGGGLSGPQQQRMFSGRGAGTCTPHQFGLTPFQSTSLCTRHTSNCMYA